MGATSARTRTSWQLPERAVYMCSCYEQRCAMSMLTQRKNLHILLITDSIRWVAGTALGLPSNGWPSVRHAFKQTCHSAHAKTAPYRFYERMVSIRQMLLPTLSLAHCVYVVDKRCGLKMQARRQTTHHQPPITARERPVPSTSQGPPPSPRHPRNQDSHRQTDRGN